MTKRIEDYQEDTGYQSRLKIDVQAHTHYTYTVPLTTEVVGPDYYLDVFNMLINATPQDTVVFLINSPGGRLDGLTMILEGIALTDAKTEAVIIGNAYSAASFIPMAVDECIVLPSADMLCHSVRYGVGGKSADIASNVGHTSKISNRMFHTYYDGFLTEAEIERVIDGKELYLDSEEITERLMRRAEYLQDKFPQEEINVQLEQTSPDSAVQPQKRGGKSTKKQ